MQINSIGSVTIAAGNRAGVWNFYIFKQGPNVIKAAIRFRTPSDYRMDVKAKDGEFNWDAINKVAEKVLNSGASADYDLIVVTPDGKQIQSPGEEILKKWHRVRLINFARKALKELAPSKG